MATEHMAHDDDTLTAEEEAAAERARADAAAGRVYNNVTTEALTAFGRLEDAQAQRLLANPTALKQWLTCQPIYHLNTTTKARSRL